MKQGGFRAAGHVVFRKRYASSARFLQYRHEMAYLLLKGCPPTPEELYLMFLTGIYGPTACTRPRSRFRSSRLLLKYSARPAASCWTSFCGSGSTLIAARDIRRRFIGIEFESWHHHTCRRGLAAA